MQVDKEGKFRIIQLGDLMNDGTSYNSTNKDIKNIIDLIKPNLIVITGDIVDPTIGGNYEENHKNSMQAIIDANIPWMWTGGNNVDGLSRDQLLGVDQELNFKNSWSGYKWDTYNEDAKYNEEELGYFTSRIPIMDTTGKREVMSVYAFDSEDFKCAE